MAEELGFGFAEEVPQEPEKKTRKKAAGAKKNELAKEKAQEKETVVQESLLQEVEQEPKKGRGGAREGSGRKATGRKRPNHSIRATDEEYKLVMQFLQTLRANAKKEKK